MESETNNFLNWVEIKNFKSIKDLRLDCKRVNVFIGKPNVGKSNILEGLGLLGAEYGDSRKFMEGSVRYNRLSDLFFDHDLASEINIITESIESRLEKNYDSFRTSDNQYDFVWKFGRGLERRFFFDEQGKDIGAIAEVKIVTGPIKMENPEIEFEKITYGSFFVKKYNFSNLTTFENSFQKFLLPPNGPNLYEVIRRNKELASEFAMLFTEQNLEFVLYDEKQEIILQKKVLPFVIQYPFFSIADTFRRFMFYITAIESNKNSVLIFEEPEVHSFPPYTQEMAYRMIYDEDNQYFISTHSPYLLHTLIENLDNDHLNVYITYYENYETKVKLLTPDNLREVLDFSIDVFFNLDKFLVDVVNA